MSINIILTVITIIVAANQNDNILQKILIPVGPPVICSVIIWFVLQNALNSEDYSLIGGYNEKYNYNIKELRNIISFIQGYTVVVSLIANFVLFIFSFFPEYKSDYPALVVELKWNQNAQTAMQQIKDRKYPDSVLEYTGDILLVAINYDKDKKEHQCMIEQYEKK